MEFFSVVASFAIDPFPDAAEVQVVREFGTVVGADDRLTHVAVKVEAGCPSYRVSPPLPRRQPVQHALGQLLVVPHLFKKRPHHAHPV